MDDSQCDDIYRSDSKSSVESVPASIIPNTIEDATGHDLDLDSADELLKDEG